jgi:DNA-binding transcriptional LysR family regulator
MNNWDDIRYFLSVARCGNVSAAAKELGVNHSTVSRRI